MLAAEGEGAQPSDALDDDDADDVRDARRRAEGCEVGGARRGTTAEDVSRDDAAGAVDDDAGGVDCRRAQPAHLVLP